MDLKVHLIPCAVNPKEFINYETNNNSNVVKILHCGRIVTRKGVTGLVRVYNKLSGKHNQIELHVVGDGEEFDLCRKLVDEYNLDDMVIFHGFVSQEK